MFGTPSRAFVFYSGSAKCVPFVVFIFLLVPCIFHLGAHVDENIIIAFIPGPFLWRNILGRKALLKEKLLSQFIYCNLLCQSVAYPISIETLQRV